MANNGNCFETHLIDGNGLFNDAGIEHFVKNVDLVNCGLSYAVVSIIGPQSSGKSTLLNHLFGTEFTQMNGELGRTQTTKGIWIARSKGIDPLTLVLDVEGIDGKERGQNDTAFEKRSSLFAITVSDVVLINVWNNDIGRENAGNRPLLRTVFQVSKKLCDPRKTKLLFVVRDLAQTPLVLLDEMLREDIKRIWEDVITDGTPLNDYFIVEVVGLPNYQYKLEDFKTEVEILRQRFFRSISPGGIAGNRNIKGVVPASGFFCHSQQIWKRIKENKDLDLPSIQIMVATVRCQQIAKEKCDTFAAKKEWCQLEDSVKDGTIPGFVKKLNSLIGVCLSEYEAESMGYDEGQRSMHRNQLQQNLLQLFKPALISALKNTRSRVQNEFKHSLDNALNRGAAFSVAANSCIKSCMSHFDQEFPDIIVIQQAESDKNEVREKLQRDIDAYIISLRATKISKLTSSYQEKLKADLAEPVGYILGEAKSDAWPSIRMLLQDVTKSAISNFLVELSVLDVDGDTRKEIITSLETCGRSVVEGKVRDEARKVFFRMKDRFTMLFSYDSNSRPRVWKGDEDIEGLARTAYSASLELLSIMSAIRLGNDDFANIETTLKYALLVTSNGSRSEEFDLLSSNTWKQVPPSRTLITPLQCKELWDQFKPETNQIVGSAIEQHNHVKDAKFKRVEKIVGTVATAVIGVAGAVGAVVTAATGGIPLAFLPWFQ